MLKIGQLNKMMTIYKRLLDDLLTGNHLSFVSKLPISKLKSEELENLLFSAIDEECEVAIKVLVEEGVDFGCKESESKFNMTALQVAIDNEVMDYTEKYQNNYRSMPLGIIKLLVDLGFDPLIENSEGVNSIEFAAIRFHYEAYNYILETYPKLVGSHSQGLYPLLTRPRKPDKWGKSR